MDEPFFRAATPDGKTVVEVKVSEEGVIPVFQCSVIVNGHVVTETLETEYQGRMLGWVRKQMTEAMRRSKPAEAS
jgi:type IV secretory pathway protease TraF